MAPASYDQEPTVSLNKPEQRARGVPLATDQNILDLPTEHADCKNGTARGQGLIGV